MNHRWLCTLVTLTTLPFFGCSKDKDDDPDDPTTSSGAWLVGDEGEMLRLAADGEVQTYPLDTTADLTAITCVGEQTAWVAGENGLVLHTNDAGQTWTQVDVDTDAHLRSVAASEPATEGTEVVAVVGDDGAFWRSADGGEHWAAVEGPAAHFTGVAVDDDGELTLATTMDGSIWRSEGGAPAQQVFFAQSEVLHAISIGGDGEIATAVGDLGLLVTSHDAGETWEPLALPTTRHLYAVHVGHHGDLTIAVGEAGIVVSIDDRGTSTQELLDPALSLRGLHLRTFGPGQAVGDTGIVLLTEDAGTTWTPLEVGTTQTLRGVDDFHFGAHL